MKVHLARFFKVETAKSHKALLHYAKTLNVKLDVLESAVEANELIVNNQFDLEAFRGYVRHYDD